MIVGKAVKSWAIASLLSASVWCSAQSAKSPAATANSSPLDTSMLKRDFFAVIRSGDSQKFLSYVPAEGLNVGSEPRHESREEIQHQLEQRRGLYCTLFDSSCLETPIKLDASSRPCSYREALTKSRNPRLAATQTVRNGVHQAILAAQPNAKECPATKLIDFIFNYDKGGWKLFTVP